LHLYTSQRYSQQKVTDDTFFITSVVQIFWYWSWQKPSPQFDSVKGCQYTFLASPSKLCRMRYRDWMRENIHSFPVGIQLQSHLEGSPLTTTLLFTRSFCVCRWNLICTCSSYDSLLHFESIVCTQATILCSCGLPV
jgi:hypothetical protein